MAGKREHEPRMLDTCELDKAWGAIHYFVSGSGETSPENPEPKDFLVTGVQLDGTTDHVAIHTPQDVAHFAELLSAIPTEQLMDRFDAARMNQENVYGKPWDESGRDYVLQVLEPFRQFVRTAAEAGHAVLIVIC
jgi:hypothetical protein